MFESDGTGRYNICTLHVCQGRHCLYLSLRQYVSFLDVILAVVIMVGLSGDAFSPCTYVGFVDELNLLQKMMLLRVHRICY